MILCCRCGRRILKSAVPPQHAETGPAAYGRTCALRLGLLLEPNLLQRRSRHVKRKPTTPRQDERQMRIPA